jgi:hypothetical protein
MTSRPDLDIALPRYQIRYLTERDGWQTSTWKMTIPYAYKQYAMTEWDPVWESAEYYTEADRVSGDPNSTARFLRSAKGE